MLQWIVENLLPLDIVDQDEMGVFLRGGRFKKNVEPGCYFTWPYYDSITVVKVTTQIKDLPNQDITISGKSYSVSGSITYFIEDARKAILDVYDFDVALVNKALEVICNATERTQKKLTDEVFEELDKACEAWGIAVTNFQFNRFVPCRVIRLIGDSDVESTVNVD